MVFLVAALLLLLPMPLDATLALVRRIAPAITSAVPHVAVMELRAGRARAIAIAATGAIAVFGSVAIETAHGDLLHGLENAAHRPQLVHRRLGLAVRQLQPAEDRAVQADRAGQARTPAGCARRAHLPRRAARHRRTARLGDRPAVQATPAAAGQPDRRRQPAARDRRGARRRLGRALAGDRRRTPSAHRLRPSRCPRPTRRRCASPRCPRTSAGRPARSS